MGVFIREKKNHLYLDVVVNQKHHWQALHLTLTGNIENDKEVLRIAEMCRTKKECELVCNEWDINDKKEVVLLLDYIERNITDDVSNGVYKKLKTFSKGKMVTLSQVDARYVQDFQKYLSKFLKNTSVNVYMIKLNTIFNSAVSERLITFNPCSTIKALRKDNVEKEPLTVEEVRQFASVKVDELKKSSLSRLNVDLYIEIQKAFIFDCYTGLRFSDLSTLQWKDIVEKDGQNWVVKVQQKTRDKVTIPLNKNAMSLLGERKDKSQKVFNWLSKVEYATTLKALRMIAKKAEIDKPVTWHIARHTVATLLLSAHTDISVVSKMLGHKDISTTAIYAEVTDPLKVQASNIIPNFYENT